jgi:carboxypeptidase C (cathepsin A)
MSQDGNANAPLSVWFNGGPGCSSLEGAFQETGPLWTAPGGAGLQRNDFSYNKFSHTMYLEAPACVGFSYATLGGCAHDDNSTAANNLQALLKFFTLFPELKANKLVLQGESYAGIYIPMLAYNVHAHNQGAGAADPIQLRGIMVGNGCIGNAAGVCGSSPYGNYLNLAQFHGHSFLSDTAFEGVLSACGNFTHEDGACLVALAAAEAEIGDNYDVYDLYSNMWGTCNYGDKAFRRRPVHQNTTMGRLLARQAAALRASNASNQCTNDADLTRYLNQPDVQAALHVKPVTWQECGGVEYVSEMADERQVIYPTLINDAKIDILIFNGQSDACVPSTDNQWWTRSMGLPVKSRWAPWSATDGSNGGYVIEYDTGGAHRFTFATVRGAGHMVAQVQPLYASDLAKKFLAGEALN